MGTVTANPPVLGEDGEMESCQLVNPAVPIKELELKVESLEEYFNNERFTNR